jgi:hypothetical protein
VYKLLLRLLRFKTILDYLFAACVFSSISLWLLLCPVFTTSRWLVCTVDIISAQQGSFFWLQNKEGLTLIGVFPLSLAKKGTLTPEKRTLLHSDQSVCVWAVVYNKGIVNVLINLCARYDQVGCSYLYDIDAHLDVIGPRSGSKPFVIDATRYGNVARFINHR